jgi:hypothetical protein
MRHKARGVGVRYQRVGNLGYPARAAALKIGLQGHNNKLIRGKAVEK